MKITYWILFSLLLVVLSGCAAEPTAAPLATEQNPLVGTHWKLTSFENWLAMKKYPIYLHFDEKKMSGEMGCNNYDGDYQVEAKDEESQISVGVLAMTVQLCQDEALMDQETRYIEAWRVVAMPQPAVFRVGQEGAVSTLEILDAEGNAVLTFEASESRP